MKKPTQEEIDNCANWAAEGIDEGRHYPGMSYEQGVADALHWMQGDSDNGPHED